MSVTTYYAIRCDLCGRLLDHMTEDFSNPPKGWRLLPGSRSYANAVKHCCPECWDDIRNMVGFQRKEEASACPPPHTS